MPVRARVGLVQGCSAVALYLGYRFLDREASLTTRTLHLNACARTPPPPIHPAEPFLVGLAAVRATPAFVRTAGLFSSESLFHAAAASVC